MLYIGMQGKVWRKKNWYVVEIPALDLMTQGKNKDDALYMINDALSLHLEELGVKGFDPDGSCWVDKDHGNFSVAVPWSKKVVGFMMQRLRDRTNLSQRDLAKKLGYSSHNSIAAYETGKIQPTLEKFSEIMSGLGVNVSIGISLESRRA